MSIRTRRELLNRSFDVVINLTAEKWWAVWFQVAPIRIGLFPRANPGLMGRLYSKSIRRSFKPLLHNSEHYLLPALALGIDGPFDRRMAAPESDVDDAAVSRFLAAQPDFDPKRPLVVLHPGTSQASKCWPAEHFAALIDRLGADANVVITGSPEERPLAESIARQLSTGVRQPIIAAGGLADLGETTALVRRATVVVTGDTSMLHIASAVDVPVVAIYGSTRPDDNVPLFGKQSLVFNPDVACSPCSQARCPLRGVDHMKCMRTISPDRVYDAITSVAAV
jgi:heptosyltransferase-2